MEVARFIRGVKTGIGAIGTIARNACVAGLIIVPVFPVGALHYDREAVSFSTLDELLSSGKELKVWSDTTIPVLGISFTYHSNGISWQYTAGRAIPCTLSVGDTLSLVVHATYIKNADSPAADSLAITTGPGQFNWMRINVAAFPHSLVTTATVTGPASDTAGKCLTFSRDSVYCTLRHRIYYSFVWDDGFRSPWMETRAAVHSWSFARQYAVRAFARCQEYLFADTLQRFPVSIASAAINASTGAYTSGFFTREVGGATRLMDFSRGDSPPLDSDVVFNSNGGYSFVAHGGLLSLGILDSFPGMQMGGCGGVLPETSSVCKAQKQVFDSIVGSLHIVCPAVMRDTVRRMSVGEFCCVKTTEGHYAILLKAGEYIGGIDREYFYRGYQNDGNRLLSPLTTSVAYTKAPRDKPVGQAGIKFLRQGNNVQMAFPRGVVPEKIAVYACDGSLVYRHSFTAANLSAPEPFCLPGGMYIVSVQSEKKVLRQLVHIY